MIRLRIRIRILSKYRLRLRIRILFRIRQLWSYFLFFLCNFCPPGSGSGFRIRIRIHWHDGIPTRISFLVAFFEVVCITYGTVSLLFLHEFSKIRSQLYCRNQFCRKIILLVNGRTLRRSRFVTIKSDPYVPKTCRFHEFGSRSGTLTRVPADKFFKNFNLKQSVLSCSGSSCIESLIVSSASSLAMQTL
jgi:hypothetical protein